MNRLEYPFDHEWHVCINNHQSARQADGKPFQHWPYEAKRLADEVPRMVLILRDEREGNLPQIHQQCSHSPTEPVEDNHLTCCFGIECRKCPELLALDSMARVTPEDIDVAKAWTCAAHILREGKNIDTSEGYLMTEGDRMFWERVYTNLAESGTTAPESP